MKINSILNSINSNIRFTIEEEFSHKLPFMDIMILRQSDGRLKFDVYRKETTTDRYLDYRSFNPINHKINTIKTLQKRAFNICSDESYKISELDLIRRQLINNGYPRRLKVAIHWGESGGEKRETAVFLFLG